MALFYATVYKARVTDITVQELQQRGIRGLLLDVDNTLTTHGSQQLSEEVEMWLASMQQAGIRLTVVSNSWEWRVAPFAERIGLEHTSLSCKPSPFGFMRGVRRMGLKKRECAVVGDQVFTDILGANLYGVVSFQVDPIAEVKGKPTLQLKRWVERKWIDPRRGKHL